MALDEYFVELETLLKATETAKTLVPKLEASLEDINSRIANATIELDWVKQVLEDSKNKNYQYYARIASLAESDTKMIAADVLREHIVRAVVEAPEYATPVLLN